MLSMLRGVVVEGTGTQAAIPGYTVAGKTGTAAKIDSDGTLLDLALRRVVRRAWCRRRSRSSWSWSWSTSRAAAIYGGDVAAPAFREIARFNLQYLEIPQDAPKTAATKR